MNPSECRGQRGTADNSDFEELFNRLHTSNRIVGKRRRTWGFLLVFDNYQKLADNASTHEIILQCLSELPAGVRAVLIIMLRLVNNRELMGEYVNSKRMNAVTWATVSVLIVLTLLLLAALAID